MQLRADSLASTHAIAAALAMLARVGDVIVLAGEMGAGKTAFARGFGRALGVDEPITSPTFTLVHSYPVPGRKLVVHHADLYRLDTTGDVEDLALHELAEFGGIVLVEWGDVAAASIGDHLEIRLSFVDASDAPTGEDDVVADDGEAFSDLEDGRRRVDVHAHGPAWTGRWDALVASLEPFRC